MRLPSNSMTAQDLREMWAEEAVVPCKVRTGDGVETVCFQVGDFFVDCVTGNRLDNIKNKSKKPIEVHVLSTVESEKRKCYKVNPKSRFRNKISLL